MLFISLFLLALIIGLILYFLPKTTDHDEENDLDYPANINAMYNAEFGDEDNPRVDRSDNENNEEEEQK